MLVTTTQMFKKMVICLILVISFFGFITHSFAATYEQTMKACLVYGESKELTAKEEAYRKDNCKKIDFTNKTNIDAAINICKSEGDSGYRDGCLVWLAIEKNDLQICTNNFKDLWDKSDCIAKMAIEKNDINICSKIAEYGDYKSLFDCEVAFYTPYIENTRFNVKPKKGNEFKKETFNKLINICNTYSLHENPACNLSLTKFTICQKYPGYCEGKEYDEYIKSFDAIPVKWDKYTIKYGLDERLNFNICKRFDYKKCVSQIINNNKNRIIDEKSCDQITSDDAFRTECLKQIKEINSSNKKKLDVEEKEKAKQQKTEENYKKYGVANPILIMLLLLTTFFLPIGLILLHQFLHHEEKKALKEKLANFKYGFSVYGLLLPVWVMFGFVPLAILDPATGFVFIFLSYLMPIGMFIVPPIVSGVIYYFVGRLIDYFIKKELSYGILATSIFLMILVAYYIFLAGKLL